MLLSSKVVVKGQRHAQHLASVVDEGKEEEVRVADDVFSYHNVIAKRRDLEGSGMLLSDPCAGPVRPMSLPCRLIVVGLVRVVRAGFEQRLTAEGVLQ